jgi:CD2 antigen cytoplasmic tail-binding protein 2
MPSVKFAASVEEDQLAAKKRRRDMDMRNENDIDEPSHEVPTKKPKRNRPNEDEIDDVDEWKEEDDDKGYHLPSEKELLEAKRQRRQNRAGLDADETTTIDEMTSLASDGIAIEPFHMKNEESDGMGYFDGDTYVFRKRNVEQGEDEEPDAWLDRLREDEEVGKKSQYQPPVARAKKEQSSQETMDDLSKEELYMKMLPLLNGPETVSQALIRYGRLIKEGVGSESLASSKPLMSPRVCLNDLTGAANALLLKGDVDIYQSRKVDIERLLAASNPSTVSKMQQPTEKQPPAQWEYKGNQDGALHGPYTTEQMLAWIKAGYFIGSQRVRIRTLRDKPVQLSTQDDLLADLLDNDIEDPHISTEKDMLTKGEWQWSNEVDFYAYLPDV